MPIRKTAARGPLSAAVRENIRAMARDGASIEDISAAVGRSHKMITAVLVSGAVKSRPAAKNTPARSRPARSEKAPKAGKSSAFGKPRKGDHSGLLEHRFWLRSELAVSLSLPGDLRPDEAERLAAVVCNLPFSR